MCKKDGNIRQLYELIGTHANLIGDLRKQIDNLNDKVNCVSGKHKWVLKGEYGYDYPIVNSFREGTEYIGCAFCKARKDGVK